MAKPLIPGVVKIQLQKSLKDLPPLPVVVLKVLEETQNATSSANSMQELIQLDNALASKVLRVVNSPYYGLSGQVSSLLQACVILGNQQIRNLVMSMGVMSVVQASNSAQTEAMNHSRLHALAAGFVAKSLAKKRSLDSKEIEDLFVATLLHDLGYVYILCNFQDAHDAVYSKVVKTGRRLAEVEQETIGLTHAEVGAMMADQWKLPGQLSNLIRQHEGPFSEGATPSEMIVHLGDELTKYLCFSAEPGVPDTIDPYALAWFNAQPGELEATVEEVHGMVDTLRETLSLAA